MSPAGTDGGAVSEPVSRPSRNVLPPPTGEQKFHVDLDGAARPALQLAVDLLAHDVPDLGREGRERLPDRPLALLDGREVGEGEPLGLCDGLDRAGVRHREQGAEPSRVAEGEVPRAVAPRSGACCPMTGSTQVAKARSGVVLTETAAQPPNGLPCVPTSFMTADGSTAYEGNRGARRPGKPVKRGEPRTEPRSP